MSRITHWMDRAWYPNHAKNWDDQLFREAVLRNLKPEMTMLDLGAGAGIVNQMNFRELASRVCGVDLDPRVVDNPFLDEGRVSDAGEIPFPDESFDIVFSDNVLEHLEIPDQVFREVARVLKEGGGIHVQNPE
jgi:ubiquinone/menaquinone biosynthesis C-methylase UbiE